MSTEQFPNTPGQPEPFRTSEFFSFEKHFFRSQFTSDQVWFVNDQIAFRFIEEIDFDYCANDATTALLTAAA